MRGAGEARPEIPLRSFQKKNQGVVMLLCTLRSPGHGHGHGVLGKSGGSVRVVSGVSAFVSADTSCISECNNFFFFCRVVSMTDRE